MTEKNLGSLSQLDNILEMGHSGDLRQMLARFLQVLMDAEVSKLCNAGYGERSAERSNQRNGHRERPFETMHGTIDLQIPKVRKGTYFPSFLEPRRRWERAFVNVVSEAYVQGVSTRSVEQLVEAMGAKGMSRSEVSRMSAELDKEVAAFRERPLGEHAMPYVWLDAMYTKVRTHGRVVSRAVLIAIGVNEKGEREVLGVDVADKEMESSWRAFLRDLVRRGLRGVQLVISDAHEGLRKGIPATLNGVSWQRCYVHFIRNVMDKVPKSARDLVAATLRNIFNQSCADHAERALRDAVKVMREKWPRAATSLEEAESEVLSYYAFPAAHWKQIRSTNPLERLNKELRRRERVVGIFPSNKAVLRLLGMILVEQDDEWKVGRRYFSASSMAELAHKATAPTLEATHVDAA